MTHARPFIPAFGLDALLPLYDGFTWLLGGARAREELVTQAAMGGDERVLDIGCGTGSLLATVARTHPRAALVGLDPDPRALARAARKAPSARFDQGYADALPYPDRTFDRVFSSFMLHHLAPASKGAMLAEVRRVLAPGGSLHLVDLGGRPAGAWGLARALPRVRDQSGDDVLRWAKAAGLDAVLVAPRVGPAGLTWLRATPR